MDSLITILSSPFAIGTILLIVLVGTGVYVFFTKKTKSSEVIDSNKEGATLSQQWKPEAPQTIVEGIGEVKEQAVVASEGNGGVVSTEVLDPLPMVPPTDETKQQ